MKRLTNILAISALAVGLCACATAADGDDTAANDTGTGDDTGTPGTGDGPAVTTSPEPTTVTATAGETEGPADSSGSGGEPETTGDTPEFHFSETPPERMTQVDRMGMPAINTAVISSKDDYNGSTPEDDADGVFVAEIVASLEGLHAALDDDLMGAGLVPCAVDDCVAQAAPLVVPDVLKIDPSMPAGFPNGRLLADPVIDVTLAVVLVDLSVKGQGAGVLAGLPLNPPANDVAFLEEFPFLAEPHQ